MNEKKRNGLFEEKKHFVEMTVNKHYIILQSCRMEVEDVKQELYLRLLELIGSYNPKKCPNFDAYLLLSLKYRLWNLAAGSKRTGMPGAPVRGFRLISLESIADYYQPSEYDMDSTYNSLWLEKAIEELPHKERSTLNDYLKGSRRIRCNNLNLRSARRCLINNNPKLSHLSALGKMMMKRDIYMVRRNKII